MANHRYDGMTEEEIKEDRARESEEFSKLQGAWLIAKNDCSEALRLLLKQVVEARDAAAVERNERVSYTSVLARTVNAIRNGVEPDRPLAERDLKDLSPEGLLALIKYERQRGRYDGIYEAFRAMIKVRQPRWDI